MLRETIAFLHIQLISSMVLAYLTFRNTDKRALGFGLLLWHIVLVNCNSRSHLSHVLWKQLWTSEVFLHTRIILRKAGAESMATSHSDILSRKAQHPETGLSIVSERMCYSNWPTEKDSCLLSHMTQFKIIMIYTNRVGSHNLPACVLFLYSWPKFIIMPTAN